jgi:hypothetical protein
MNILGAPKYTVNKLQLLLLFHRIFSEVSAFLALLFICFEGMFDDVPVDALQIFG